MAIAHCICGLLALLVVPIAASITAPAPWTKSCKSTDTATDVSAGIDLSGKIMIYTGADGNLASQSTLALARANASLILACRTHSKCEAVRDNILNKTAKYPGVIEVDQLDLSSRASINDFVKRTTTNHPRIDVLINSAATYGDFMTQDKLVAAMEINLLGPALLTHLLFPVLRGHGRFVNVAAAAFGTKLPENMTAKQLAELCTAIDPKLNQTGGYYGLSKFLMVHHAIEAAKREPTVAAVALAPGVAFKLPNVPDWLKHDIMHYPYPDWMLKRLPKDLQRYILACTTNEAGLASCPETQEQGAGVIVAAAAWPDVDSHSGIYLDFDTKPLPHGAPNAYGPWTQSDPTCVPRQPDPMDKKLRSDWYDKMLRLMGVGSSDDAHEVMMV